MRARRALLALAATGLVATLAPAALGGAVASAAEPVVEVGWWTRSPGQDAPEGGFAVAAAPDGPTTVAALRVTLAGLRTAVVEVVETGGLNQDGAAVRACTTTSLWVAVPGGPLADAPAADCEAGSVDLVRDAGARRWRGDLTPLVRDGSLSVVLVPGEATGAGILGSDVRFAAPEVAVTGDAGTPAGGGSGSGFAAGGGSTTGSDPTTGGSTSGSGGSPSPSATFPTSSPTPTAGSSSGFGGFSAGSSPGGTPFATTPAPSVAPVGGSAPQPLAEGPLGEVAFGTGTGTEAVNPSFTPLSGDEVAPGARWGQAVFFVVVSAAAAVAVAGGNRFRRQRVTTA